jgi:hypothetical protein
VVFGQALATTKTWDFNTSGDYSASDPSNVEVSGGNAHLIEAPSPVWFDNNYLYRTRIKVSAGTDAVAANFTVSTNKNFYVMVNDGKLLNDGKDLRLAYWNSTNNRYERFDGVSWVSDVGRVGMDVVLEPLGGGSYPKDNNVKIWFALGKAIAAGQADSNYFLYYGNSNESVAPPQDGNRVFQFYDSFEGSSINTSIWDVTQVASAFTVAGGMLKMDSSKARLKSLKAFTYPLVYESEFLNSPAVVGAPTNGYMVGGFWNATTNGFGILVLNGNDYYRNNAAFTSLGVNHTDNNWHSLKLVAPNSTQMIVTTQNLLTLSYVRNAVTYAHPNGILNEVIALGKRYDDAVYTQVTAAFWKFVRVRSYVANEPTQTIQSEQTRFSALSPYVYPNATVPLYDRFISFGATTTEASGTGIRFCVSKDGGTSWLWFNGVQWASSTCAYAQTSSAIDIHANGTSLGGGSFLYRALLYSQAGIATPYLEAVSLVVNDIPDAFSLNLPVHQSVQTTVLPSLSWEVSADVDAEDASLSYRLQLDDDPAFGSPLINKVVGSGTTYAVQVGDGLVDNSTYYWRVYAKDSHGDSTLSNSQILYTNALAQDPTISSIDVPSGTERVAADNLVWTAFDPDPNESLSYDLMVDNNSDFSSPEISMTGIASNTVTLSGLTGFGALVDDGIYYWKVRAEDALGAYSPFSVATNNFFYNPTNDAPTTPVLSLPANATTVVPSDELTFTSTDADQQGLTPDVPTFTVEISQNAGFTAVISTSIGKSSGVLLSALNNFGSLVNGNTYYWRATARDPHGLSSSPCAGRSFLFQLSNTAPTATTLANVPSDSIYGLTSSLEWTLSTDADLDNTVSYVIEAETDTTTGTRELTVSRTGTSATISALIAANSTGSTVASSFDNQRYFVRVRSMDNSGLTSAFSAWRRVKFNTVDLATVDLASGTTSPLNNTTVTSLQPTLNWDDLIASGGVPSSYTVDLSTNISFTSPTRKSVAVSTINLATQSVTLTDNTTYYWRVWAHDQFGDSTASVIDSMHINQANETPTVPASLNIADGTERILSDSLGWNSTDPDPADPITFDIQVDDDGGFGSPEISILASSLSKVRIADLTGSGALVDNGKYYWKVRACDSHAACSPYSIATHYFIFNPINNAPGTPTIASPADAATLTSTDAFSFSSVDPDNQGLSPDVPTFTVEVSQNAGFTSIISTTTGTVSGIIVGQLDNAANLINGNTYYWRVAARDPHGASSSPTAGRSFLYQSTNSPPTSTLFIGVPADSIYRLTSTLQWNESTDPDVGNVVSYIIEAETDTLSATRELKETRTDKSVSLQNLIVDNTSGSTTASSFDNQRYFVRIRAVDNTGFASNFSAWRRVKFNTVALATVDLSSGTTSPQNNATITTLQPTLNWDDLNPSGGSPNSYTLELSETVGFSAPTRVSIANSTLSLGSQGITYSDNSMQYWRVWAHDQFGDSTVSAMDSLLVNLTNDAPVLSASLNVADGTERILSDSLGWSATDPDPHAVLTYEIQVDEDVGFNSPEIDQVGLSLSKMRIADLTGSGSLVDDGKYYWKIRACDVFSVCSPYSSATHYFVFNPTNDAPATPVPSLPAQGAIVTQSDLFSFVAKDPDSLGLTPDIMTYNIEISLNAGFTSIVSTTSGVASGVLLSGLSSSGTLLNGTTYYWRVAARDNHGATSGFSGARTFVYQYTNSAPTVTAFSGIPTDSIYRAGSTLQWTASTDPDVGNTITYQIEAGSDTSSLTRQLTASLTGSSATLSALIALNSTGSTTVASFDNLRLFFRIRAVDNTGFGSAYSTWRALKLNTVALATVDLGSNNESPLANSTLTNLQPNLDWPDLAVTGGTPTSYSVELANNSVFTEKSSFNTVTSGFSFSGQGLFIADNSIQYWRVWARDQFGDSTLSVVDSFVVNQANESPSIPLPLNIANGTERALVDSLGWTGLDSDPRDTLTYNLRVSADANFAFPLIALNGLTKAKARLQDYAGSENLRENGKYYWEVQSKDKAGLLSAFTSPDSFFYFNNLNEKPSMPSSLSPSSGSVVTSSMYLRFSSLDADAMGRTPDSWTYTVELARDAVFNAIMSSTVGVLGDSVLVSTLQNYANFQDDSTYYWRVWAVDNHGSRSDTTDVRSLIFLHTNSPPTATAWILPMADSMLTLTSNLRWLKSTDPDGNPVQYQLEATEDTTGSSRRMVSVVADTSNTFSQLIIADTMSTGDSILDDKILFLRIRANDNHAASSPYTAWLRVLTNTENDLPTLTSLVRPNPGDSLWDTQGISWQPSGQPDLRDSIIYTVQVALDSLFTGIKATATLGEADTAVAITAMTGAQWLIPGNTYFARVRALDLANQTAGWTVATRFVLSTANQRPTKPGIIFPKNSQTLQPSNLLSWSAATDADGALLKYEVLISLANAMAPSDSSQALYWKRGVTGTSLDVRQIAGFKSWKDSTVFRWSIRSYDPENFHSLADSAEYRFVSTAPDAPEVISPRDSAQALPTTPLLWHPAIDVDAGPQDSLRYIVEVDTSDLFGTIIIRDTVSDTSQLIMDLPGQSGFESNDTLVWRVRALDSHGKIGTFSTPRIFIFNRGNEAPFAPLVNGLQEDSLLYSFQSLHWQGRDPNNLDIATLKYRLQVSRSSGFGALLADSAGLTTTQIRLDQLPKLLSNLQVGKLYYWRIAATDTGGLVSEWSVTKTFGIRTWTSKLLDIPLVLDGSGSVVFPQDTLAWSLPQYKNVRFEIAMMSLDSSVRDTFPIQSLQIDSLSHVGLTVAQLESALGENLHSGTFHWWQIRALDTLYGKVGSFSAPMHFFMGDSTQADSKNTTAAWLVGKNSTLIQSADSTLAIVIPDSAFVGTVGLVLREMPDTAKVKIADLDTTTRRQVLAADTAGHFVHADRNTRPLGQKQFIIEARDLRTGEIVQPADSHAVELRYIPQFLDTLDDGTQVVHFATPGKPKVKSDFDVNMLAFYRLDEKKNRWARQQGSSFVTGPSLARKAASAKTMARPWVSMETTHFSIYTLMAANPSTAPFSDFLVFPSPVKLSAPQATLNQARISYLITETTQIEVAIYSRTGGLVWKKSMLDRPSGGSKNEVLWDGRNQAGAYVGNGYYVVHVTARPRQSGGVHHVKQIIAVYK